MKYLNTMVTFSEFPDEIALCINITNCPFHCPGCHSPELWEDVGIELNAKTLSKLIESNKGISCVGFMGGFPLSVYDAASFVKTYYDLKTGWYWGDKKDSYPPYIYNVLDYIKLGPYIKEKGGLDNPNTNQRFYHIEKDKLVDWTYKFWKHGNEK